MRKIIWGALLASAVWGYFAGGREQLQRLFNTANEQETARVIEEREAAKIKKRIETLKQKRESDFVASFEKRPECHPIKTELQRLQCKNTMDTERTSFYKRWNAANKALFE